MLLEFDNSFIFSSLLSGKDLSLIELSLILMESITLIFLSSLIYASDYFLVIWLFVVSFMTGIYEGKIFPIYYFLSFWA